MITRTKRKKKTNKTVDLSLWTLICHSNTKRLNMYKGEEYTCHLKTPSTK